MSRILDEACPVLEDRNMDATADAQRLYIRFVCDDQCSPSPPAHPLIDIDNSRARALSKRDNLTLTSVCFA